MVGLSVYEHGISVRNYMFDILNHLRYDTPLKYNWKLPNWIHDHKEYILSNILSDEVIELYTIFHDCGKPYCLEVDENGRKHFPNHAEVSYKISKNIFNNDDSSELIKRDMDFHLLKAVDLKDFSQSKYAVTLMISALSEIHSNSTMFGGMESTSFKIKWKHTDKKGRQVLDLLSKNINKK